MYNNTAIKYVINWLNFSLVIIIIMVVVGAITRLTQSGLSMPDWKPITGIIPPINNEQWKVAFDEYKKFPEFNKVNFNIELSEYKTIYYWEYTHRMLGRFIGLLFLFPFVFFLFKKILNPNLIRRLLYLFMMGAFQGVMGWYMVKSGLVDNPYINHLRLAVHLFIAFIIIAYIYWTKLILTYPDQNNNNYITYNKFINFIICLFFIQIVYGAFTAGLKAGQNWNTFPLMEGRFIPDGLFFLKPICLNFFENDKMIQFIHRFLGLFLLLLIYLFSFKMKDLPLKYNLRVRSLVTIVSCQVFLGIITLISKVPIVLGVAHQFLAIILLLLLLDIKHSLKYK